MSCLGIGVVDLAKLPGTAGSLAKSITTNFKNKTSAASSFDFGV
jgi:hypothetical protein